MNKMTKANLNRAQALACNMMAEGTKEDLIIAAVFGVTKEDNSTEFFKKRKLLRNWVKEPAFSELYRETIRAIALPSYGRAFSRIDKQIDDENPWVAQNAARDILNRYNSAVMGDEERDLVIRIEGMPELGVPDDND